MASRSNSSKTSKVILLTGATRGLGRAMTAGFIEAGHTVIGCGQNAELIRKLSSEFGKPHRFDVLNVMDANAIRDWANPVLKEFGPPDLLINNAAIINRNTPLWEFDPEEITEILGVNIAGTINTIRAFVPAMVEKKSGVIINFSSGWGRSTSPEVAPYCATKYAVEGLTLALAQELPAGMAAIPLNPGIINTEMLQSCFASQAQNFPTPENWARIAVPYILSLGPQHNGQSLSVPG